MRIKTIFSACRIKGASIAGAVLAVMATGCVDRMPDDDPYRDYEGIRVQATVGSPDRLATRADVNTYYVTTTYYDCNFNLWLEGKDIDGNPKAEGSVYVIPSGYEGALIPKEGEKTLNWFSREEGHHFRGWTLPTDPDYHPDPATINDDIIIPFHNTHISETTNAQASEWAEGSWENGACLEQMIGAHTGPFTYNENGIYVPLQFRHLVSKVFLKDLSVVNNVDGSSTSSSNNSSYITRNVRGVITFYGMPREGIFHPCPYDETTGEVLPPYISLPTVGDDKQPWDYDEKSRVTFAATNYPRYYFWEGHEYTSTAYYEYDCWYVPPELEFNRMEFKIELYEYDTTSKTWKLSTSHGNQGAFYGDFSKIQFVRNGNSAYDDPNGGDENVLHAGEYLELSITLYEKGNPSVRGTITSWTSKSVEGSSYVHQGLYSIEQVKDLSSVMGSGDPREIENYFEMNGSGRTTADDPEGEYPKYTDKDGNEVDLKVFELFDDIGSESLGSSSSTKVDTPFNIADGYILDGQGHTINVTSSSMKIGPVRDVYLRYYYSNIERIVYIDKMGNVWLVEPFTFVETPTKYNVNDATANPFTLSLANGSVSPTS